MDYNFNIVINYCSSGNYNWSKFSVIKLHSNDLKICQKKSLMTVNWEEI